MYSFLRFLSKIVMHIFFRHVSFEGEEPDPNMPLLICANHASNWDPIGALALFPHKVRFVAKASLSKTFFVSWFLNHINLIFVNRDGNDHKALREMLDSLKAGDQVFLFPEGHRYREVDPANIKSGVGFLAQRSQAQVQCYYIDSDYRFRGHFRMIARPRIHYEDLAPLDRREGRYVMTQVIFNTIYQTNYPLEDFTKEGDHA